MPEVPVLSGSHARLEPLAERHAADLARAATGSRSSFAFTWVPDGQTEAERSCGPRSSTNRRAARWCTWCVD